MQNDNSLYEDKIKEKLSQAYNKEKNSLAGFFIHKYRFTYLILGLILIAGFYSLMSMPREAEPEVKIPYAIVNTVYLGASPADVEELVTNRIEEKIKNLENLKEFNSSSQESISSIFIEFEAEADLKESFRKLREAVDGAKSDLPDETELPVVTELNFNDTPIVTYSLVGNYTDVEMKNFADELKDELESIKDVSKVEIIGGLEREFQVVVNQEKLNSLNISLGQLINSIQLNNMSLPAGNIEVAGLNYNVRVKGKFTDVSELENIVVMTINDTPIYLEELVDIKDTFKEKESESRIGFKDEEPRNTISLQVYKKTGGNILNIVGSSQEKINEVKTQRLVPVDLDILKTNDNSKYIREDFNTLGMSAVQTIILITLILLIVLSFQGAIITALAVPVAFFMAFFFLNYLGMTLNSMVLFSLVLSLGLMVDNGIVIIEGINEYVEVHKKTVLEAAILSAWNFKWAIVSGTLTTVAAFIGLFLVSGIMGEYLSVIPKTLITTLLSSLFVAIIVIPTLAARFIKIKANEGGVNRCKRRHVIIGKYRERLQEKYAIFVNGILTHKKQRITLILSAWILFLVCALLPVVGIMKIEMFPRIDSDFFNINIELPIGSTLEKTSVVTEEVEKIVAQIPELDNYVTKLGGTAAGNAGESGSNGSYLANLIVNLKESNDRDRQSYDIAESIRKDIEAVQGAEVKLQELAAGPPSGAPIEVRIYGKDAASLSLLVDKVSNYFEKIPGVINLSDSIQDAAGEFTFSINKQKADYYGLSISTIAQTLRGAVYGAKASEVTIDKKDIDITVKYAEGSFTSANDLENIMLPTNKGVSVSLKQVANLDFEPSLLSINHRNGDNIVTVTADAEKDVDIRKVMSDFEKFSKTLELPQGYSVGIGGETEDIQKSFTEMFYSLIVGMFLIMTILVLMFDSFKQPFIILFTLPLAIPGVALGLSLLGQAFSITAFIGVVSLAGIVVNDAIVLIDRINKNVKDGLEYKEAIIEAGRARMQPIFITSLTTIAGIFPLYFANEMWKGLSLTIMCGLALATFLTLIVVPTMYYAIVPDWNKKKRVLFLLSIIPLSRAFMAHIFYQKKYFQAFVRLVIFWLFVVSAIFDVYRNASIVVIILLDFIAFLESMSYLVTTNSEFEKSVDGLESVQV